MTDVPTTAERKSLTDEQMEFIRRQHPDNIHKAAMTMVNRNRIESIASKPSPLAKGA